MSAHAETCLQPAADLPESIHPLWMVLQPIKNAEDQFPDTEYSILEQQFWASTILHIDAELARRADCGSPAEPDVDVSRLISESASAPHHAAINQLILREMSINPHALYVGFTHGILPDLAALYNDPNMHDESRTRMHTAIVGGAHGNEIKATRVLTPLPEEDIRQASLIIAHDDVADTVAALAAFVERVRAIKTGAPEDYVFVDEFVKKDLSADKRTALYMHLALEMRQLGVVAAIPVYKNRQFASILRDVAREPTDAAQTQNWQEFQLNLLAYRLEYDQTLWLMGDGMDTDIPIADLFALVPEQIRTHPAVAKLFLNTMNSKIRIGSTIKGLIGLTQYEDGTRAMRDLRTWVATRVTQALALYLPREESILQS